MTTDSNSRKIDFFYNLVRGTYGSGKFTHTFPTEMDLQLSKKMWGAKIIGHTEHELRRGLDHAQSMIQSGDRDWLFPDIGQILGCCVKHAHPSHRRFLAPPVQTEEQKAAMRAMGLKRCAELKQMLGGSDEGSQQETEG